MKNYAASSQNYKNQYKEPYASKKDSQISKAILNKNSKNGRITIL
jgi:hypothetical protein